MSLAVRTKDTLWCCCVRGNSVSVCGECADGQKMFQKFERACSKVSLDHSPSTSPAASALVHKLYLLSQG